jgi:NOL1/NOP2/fmu family ribosome biogenesis protein
MFIEHALSVLSNRQNLAALDLCASPGGKTTLLSSLPNFRVVLANEIIQSRVSALFENIVKWGAPHVFISNSDPKDFAKLGEFFDVVLVDAPCSGSGLFRKDHHAKEIWSKELVEFCSVRQKRILNDAVNVLADGGYLLYSTCSYSFEENEMNLDYLIEEHQLESVRIDIPGEWGVVQSTSPMHGGYGYRFYPDKIDGEGFFCAMLQKRSPNGMSASIAKGGIQQFKNRNIEKWIERPDDLIFYAHHEDLFAINASLEHDLKLFQEKVHMRKSGIRIGSIVRGELNPDHELTMSLLASKQIQTHDLDYEEALRFLRKEKINLFSHQRGWIIITYLGIPLGWIKAMEGRSNNYYPKNWRITLRS